jgi:phage terminase large subunit GpA-like protein
MASIADLQAEREQLKAANAKVEFERAHAETCAAKDLLAAGNALRKVLVDAMDAAAADFVSAIAGEADETRVHYLLSEAAHQWATALGEKVARSTDALPEVGARFQKGVKPRDLLTVSRWADRHREMKSGTNLPGPWVTDRTPYLREIMDSLSEHSDTSEVIFVKSVQVGATEVLYNWLGYIMHHLANKDALVVVPTKEFRNQKFNPRFSRTLTESPVLAGLVQFSSRSKKNTEDILEYGAGAKIIKAGANVSTDLRSDPVPYVVCDEIDEFPAEIPGSGDPMTLIEGRQTTFTRAKTLMVSTPKTEEASRIWAAWLKTDMRQYHVPCPHCGEYQTLEWGAEKAPYGIKFRRALKAEGDETPAHATAAWYVCRHNACIIEESEKTDMLARGRWIAGQPSVKGKRGYHINALYAPVGLGKGWKWLANKWLSCIGNTAEMQAFKNERLGLPWRDEFDAADPLAVMARLSPYGERPAWMVRSVGIDVQKDWIEVSAYDYGLDEEAWAVNHWIVPGATLSQETWDDLGALLAEIRPDCGGLDSGFNAEMAYAFARRRPWLFVLKGVKTLGTNTLIEDDGKRKQRLRHKRKTGVSPFLVSNMVGMAEITERLNLPVPEAGKARGKFIHFPAGVEAFDKGFFEQITANRKVIKKVRNRIVVEWVERTPNEAYDCWKYALAGFRLSKISPEARRNNLQKIQADSALNNLPPPRQIARRIGRIGGFK